MPETDVQEEGVEEEVLAPPVVVHCRHCGQPHDGEVPEGDDWLCVNCEHYQDQMLCPTCKQPARISLMPADLAPAPHAPARRRKAKEE